MESGGTWRGLRSWVVPGLLMLGAAAGCAPLNPPTARPGEQPFDEIHSASYESALASSHTVQPLPRSAYKRQWAWLVRRRPASPLPPQDKIHPLLRQWMATRPGTDIVRLMVTYVDTTTIPRFPNPNVSVNHEDPTNGGKADTSTRHVVDLAAIRRPQYIADTTGFAATFNARVLRTYWLIQATLVEMPLDRVDALSRQPRVRYIRPNQGGRPPQNPGDGRPVNDPKAAREQIGSDHYFDLGIAYGWMALLDTGVRATHMLMSGPSARLCLTDCVTGPCATINDLICPTSPGGLAAAPGDHTPEGHGTSSAAILTGNAQFGDAFRGTTKVWLDSFRVYDPGQVLDPDAAVRGFELAVRRLNQVIVAEMQEHTAPYADIALAAEHAYQAGAVVIAANGNNSLFVGGYPAQGSHVIGVGSYDLEALSESQGYAWGLTPDLRVKPDLLGPTSSETASNEWVNGIHPDHSLHYFGATSGATPYVAGAAALVRNWMNVGWTVTGVDPGQVYAQLILSGDRLGPFVVPSGIGQTEPWVSASAHGAGRLRLPQAGLSRSGKAWVSANLQYLEVPIEVPDNGIVRVDAAIWWPGESGATQNNLDLRIKAPGGLQSTSFSPHSVFERARVQRASGLKGTVRLRVYPTSVGADPQVVYWAASLSSGLVP